MPELPEVETIKNELLPHVIGQRVSRLTLFWAGIVRTPPVEEFCSRLVGQRILGLKRRGKYLIFSLNDNGLLIMHLRMTGSLLVKDASAPPEKFVRAILYLDNGVAVHFRDPRKFGVMWLAEDDSSVSSKLGPEPLEADFTPQVLAQRLGNRSAPIKALLCDQGVIAGIGNMYADEILYATRIHPLRLGKTLSWEEIERLYQAIRRILWAALDDKGASVENYYRPGGDVGTAHFQFQVAHGLGGKSCPVCGGPIERITVRNRGTYFCPECQR